MQRILIVDGEPHMRRAMALVLEGRGYEVREVKDGMEALAYISRNDVDLLIADVGLPDMAGHELATRSRNFLQRSLPVLLMSGLATSVFFPRGYGWVQQGMLLLEQPFTARALLAAIASALRGPSGGGP